MDHMITLLQSVVDGDLCEQYNSLDSGRKKSIANELERTPSEVIMIIILW